jgi:hypothetical protein
MMIDIFTIILNTNLIVLSIFSIAPCWLVVGMSQYLQAIKQAYIKVSESEEHKGGQKIRSLFILMGPCHYLPFAM